MTNDTNWTELGSPHFHADVVDRAATELAATGEQTTADGLRLAASCLRDVGDAEDKVVELRARNKILCDALESTIRNFELLQTRFCKIGWSVTEDSWGRTFTRKLHDWFRLFQGLIPQPAQLATERDDQAFENVEQNVTEAATHLIDDVIERFNIESLDDFTCPHMREVAKRLKYFSEQ